MILGSTRPSADPYALAARALGVPSSAGEGEIRHAFRKVAHESHPDRHAGDPNPTLLNARFRLATAARSLLLARAGNQDVRALVKDFLAAQQWHDEELKKAGVAAAPPPTGSKPGPRADELYNRPRGGAASDASQSARSWVPPEFDASGTRRAGSGGFRNFSAEEVRNARPWTMPDFGAQAGPAPGPQARAAREEPRPQAAREEARPQQTAEPPRADAFRAGFGWNPGAPPATVRPAPSEPAPTQPERPTLSEAELRRRRAQAEAYASVQSPSDPRGRHFDFEV